MSKVLLSVLDEASGAPLPARVYVEGTDERPFAPAVPPDHSAAIYDVTDPGTGIREAYVAVSRYPLEIELPPGQHVVTVERGKEYVPLSQTIEVPAGAVIEKALRLRRLFNMAERGWYSADCHVHTKRSDLPAAQLADDVNVAFPITAWTTRSDQAPAAARGDGMPQQGETVRIDDAHVYWNLNTEYEICFVQDRRFILGSFMILGHRRPLTLTCPPVRPIAEEARRQGAVIDWEKHTWPWSNMLPPVAGIDVAELSNNSMWRQRTMSCYLWDRTPMPWVGSPPLNAAQFVDYGFESWYAMLNCGYALRSGAGSANGVHPVPLGQSRVYARVDGAFTYEKWLAAWRSGRSFATNGPILLMTADGLEPGARRSIPPDQKVRVPVRVEALSVGDLDRIELVINGLVVYSWKVPPAGRGEQRHRATWEFEARIEGSSWLAVRCFEKSMPENSRFAHTGPVYFDDPSRPLRAQARQLDYLREDITHQIEKVKGVLPSEALEEYSQALRAFERKSDE
jgi:hypothetical protein